MTISEAQRRAQDKYEKKRAGRAVLVRLTAAEIAAIDAHRGDDSRAEFVRKRIKLGRLTAQT